MDKIESILRSGNLKNNPLGMTVRRNFRFFCNVQYRARLDMQDQLSNWERSEDLPEETSEQVSPTQAGDLTLSNAISNNNTLVIEK